MAVDAAFVCIAENAGEERIPYLVYFAGRGNFLGEGVYVVLEEILGEARKAGLGARVTYFELVKKLGDGRCRPELDLETALIFNFLEQGLRLLEQFLFQALGFFKVNADAAPSHLDAKGEHFTFQFKDGP